MRYGLQQPPLTFDFLQGGRVSPEVPQNIMRPSYQGTAALAGCADCNALAGCDCSLAGCDCSSLAGCEGCGTSGLGALGNFFVRRGVSGLRGATLGYHDPDAIIRTVPTWLLVVNGLITTAAGMAGAYHGYKRWGSIWGGVGWYFLGSAFWPISIPVAFMQGYAEPKK